MPNRIIKETIRTSKTINEMSDFQFRLWVYLITYVDDYGRGSADPELLKGLVFTRRKGITEASLQKSLTELANMGLIHLYTVNDEPYFCFPRWSDHQRIQTKKSKFPEPETNFNRNLQYSTVNHGESPPESNPNPNPNKEKYKKEKTAEKSKFFPPSLSEVSEYCFERKNNVNPENFIDFYTSKGWFIGKNKMKDWKAAVRTWEKKSNQNLKPINRADDLEEICFD